MTGKGETNREHVVIYAVHWSKEQAQSREQLMENSILREMIMAEPAVYAPKLLSNMTYPNCVMMALQLSEYSRVFALFLYLIIKIGNLTSASMNIC